LISKYQEIKRNEFVDNYSPHLIVNNKGRQAYPMLIYRIVNKALKSVPSLEKQSPHILRHTFATHLLNKGAELNAVKELLGHASLAATQVYTHNSIERLKEVFNQSHPKA
jgi:integrase/recombinase XerC